MEKLGKVKLGLGENEVEIFKLKDNILGFIGG
jgi:hypothetical protein